MTVHPLVSTTATPKSLPLPYDLDNRLKQCDITLTGRFAVQVHSEIRVGQRNRLRVEAEVPQVDGACAMSPTNVYEPASIASRTSEERKKRAISAKSHIFRSGLGRKGERINSPFTF